MAVDQLRRLVIQHPKLLPKSPAKGGSILHRLSRPAGHDEPGKHSSACLRCNEAERDSIWPCSQRGKLSGCLGGEVILLYQAERAGNTESLDMWFAMLFTMWFAAIAP
jgi:hypothetical protein